MKDEIKIAHERKLEEAKARLQTLGINKDAVRYFVNYGLVPVSFTGTGIIQNFSKETEDNISRFEEQHNALVYFVIFTPTSFGNMESFLYVSDEEEEWEMDRADIKDGYAMTWTENLTHPQCSEFGSIGFTKTANGGLDRVS